MITKYRYKYPEINFNFSNLSKWEIEFDLIFDDDIDFVDNPNSFDDFYLLKTIHYKSLEKNICYAPKFPFSRVCFQPKLKGKNKWFFLEKKNTKVEVNDLPDLISCNAFTYLHPKERNWFLHKNCSFTDDDCTKVDWINWSNYGFIYFYLEFLFYYKLICELIKMEVENRNLEISTYDDWKNIIIEQIKFDGKYKLSENQFEELTKNFMRDFIYLWD